MPVSPVPPDPVGLDEDTLVARLRVAGCVFAEEEARLLRAAASGDDLAALLERRTSGEPLEYILGWVDFAGLRVAVDPGVFVPRRRTEFLVRLAAGHAPPGGTVVDLACGCGAVGLAVAARVGNVSLYAVDIEPAAVACARRNLEPSGGTVLLGDLYGPLPPGLRGTVDALVANVPYVPSAAVTLMPPEARLYEPLVTLDGGPDGLDVLRAAAAGAREWLVPGGHLLVEIGEDQAPAATEAFAGAGLTPTVRHDGDLYATVIVGRRG